MLAVDRLLEIEGEFSDRVLRIVALEFDGETLRLVLYLEDGPNLRVSEQWQGAVLKRYSYYWLTAENVLQIGWDNAPHHTEMSSFPHHKHVGEQNNLCSSGETCLEDVMEFILSKNG